MSEDRRKNLRDTLDDLDRYFDDFSREIEEAVRNSMSEVRSQTRPFMAGFALKFGPEGKPSVQFFGDSPVGSDGYRSPLHEQIVDEAKQSLKLVLDMPGVEKTDIKVDATEENGVITAERESRKYKANIAFKQPVVPESGKAEYKNGVLEISFSLKDKANKGLKRVDIV